MYDIMNVGHEYIMAEKCRKDGDVENAIKHYQSAIDNYKYDDNEYTLSPDSPYEITELGETISFLSVNKMMYNKEFDIVKHWKLIKYETFRFYSRK